jgi:hypothetical protein
MVTDSERASRGGGDFQTGPREWKVQPTLTNEVPVIRLEPTHAEFCNVFKMKRFGKVVSWQNADVACSRVESVCESGEECSSFGQPRQTYDDSDVVPALAGHCTDCEVFISMACIKFAGVIS